MKIEEVEVLEFHLNDPYYTGTHDLLRSTLSALRAEAWHPIEKAEELGAKDGRWVLLWFPWADYFRDGCWSVSDEQWECSVDCKPFAFNPTHFRFINPPEGA